MDRENMCKYCVKYGDGKKWYLNPRNYSDEVVHGESTKVRMEDTLLGQLFGLKGTIQEIMTTAQRFKVDVGLGEKVDDVFPDLHDDSARVMREQIPAMMEQAVAGQVVPLEDAEKIIDLNEGDIFVLPCICRKYYGGREKMCCMFLRPAAESLQKNIGPWDKPNKMVSKDEAKRMLRELDREGLVHGIFWCPAPVPTMLCNCDYPYCIAIRARFHYNVDEVFKKGEYVALVNREDCNGCGGAPRCQTRCIFGALKFSPTTGKVHANQMQCWGCGLCRTACPNDAIKLLPREEIPQLKNVW
ncbi:MAG: 4Fe-4S binding protein [Candidatus Jordarchaeaceae archaeon]